MQLVVLKIWLFLCCFSFLTAFSQDVGTTGNETGFILRKEISFNFLAHSEGIGIGFRYGQNNTVNSQRFIDIGVLNMKHPKEYKVGNIYMLDNARKFVYGKQNHVMILRAGLGSLKVLNEEPYWGGVDVRRFYVFGASVAMAKPSYLYIIDQSASNYTYYLTLERYNPEVHNMTNIYGRGPWLEGLGESRFFPGLYFKGGFSFEYGPERKLVRYIETGLAADVYLGNIPIMAENPAKNFFITFYVSANFGKRYNP